MIKIGDIIQPKNEWGAEYKVLHVSNHSVVVETIYDNKNRHYKGERENFLIDYIEKIG